MIHNRDIIKALQALRNKPECGALSAEALAAGRNDVLARIGATDFSHPRYSWKDYSEFYVDRFRHAVLRPAMVGVGLLVLAVGGWMTSVSAAEQSVPGDFLYPVKIASEQAQLSIATSDRARAELHMEFASRRLAEANTLSGSESVDKAARMKTAVVAFQSEMAEAQTAMQNLGTTDDGAKVASALDNKVDEYAAAIEQTAATMENAPEVTAEVADAKQNVTDAGTQAVEVLVNTVEAAPEKKQVAEDLQKSFQKNLAAIDQEVKLTLGRIAVIEQAINNHLAVLPPNVDLRFMTSRLEHFNTQIHEAMNVLAAGGYRSAFEVLTGIQSTVDEVEQQVIDLELSVVAQRDASVDVAPIEETP